MWKCGVLQLLGDMVSVKDVELCCGHGHKLSRWRRCRQKRHNESHGRRYFSKVMFCVQPLYRLQVLEHSPPSLVMSEARLVDGGISPVLCGFGMLCSQHWINLDKLVFCCDAWLKRMRQWCGWKSSEMDADEVGSKCSITQLEFDIHLLVSAEDICILVYWVRRKKEQITVVLEG